MTKKRFMFMVLYIMKMYPLLLYFKFSLFFDKPSQLLLRYKNKSLLRLLKKQNYSNPELFNRMGNIYLKAHNFKMAWYCFARSLKLAPNNDIYYSNLGYSLYCKDEHEMAKEAFNRAIEINPANNITWLNRSYIEYCEGNCDSALFYCNKSIDSNGSYFKAYFDRGIIYLKICKYALALEDFRKCIKLNIFYFRAYKRKNEAKRKLRSITRK